MASELLESIINDTIHPLAIRDLAHASPLRALGRAQADDSLKLSPQAQANRSSTLDIIDSQTNLTQELLEMGQQERLFWMLLFALMVLVAAGGNMMVIYIVSTNREMKSVTNYFLVNLSLADTMVSTLNVIFNFISMLDSHWPFGRIYCKISNFIAILSIAASVFTLTAISCDRYTAIIHPLRPRMSHRHALGWILLIWTLSAALALPNIVYSVVLEDRLVNENLAHTCTMVWPDGRYPLSSYDHIYNIVILVLTYLVPISTMAMLYYKVGRELWGCEAIGEDVENQRRALKAKKKIVKMMIVVVIIFAACWLPYHAFFVVNYYLPTIFQDGPLLYQRCYLLMYWLAMSNSMYNPIIIYFMNSKIYTSPMKTRSEQAAARLAQASEQTQQRHRTECQPRQPRASLSNHILDPTISQRLLHSANEVKAHDSILPSNLLNLQSNSQCSFKRSLNESELEESKAAKAVQVLVITQAQNHSTQEAARTNHQTSKTTSITTNNHEIEPFLAAHGCMGEYQRDDEQYRLTINEDKSHPNQSSELADRSTDNETANGYADQAGESTCQNKVWI